MADRPNPQMHATRGFVQCFPNIMATNEDLDQEQPDREFAEEASLLKTGLTQPDLGPSDSSDSASDSPPGISGTDSDRNNTGARPQVENTGEEDLEEDIEPDHIVGESEAGLAYTPPDPERNGGAE